MLILYDYHHTLLHILTILFCDSRTLNPRSKKIIPACMIYFAYTNLDITKAILYGVDIIFNEFSLIPRPCRSAQFFNVLRRA